MAGNTCNSNGWFDNCRDTSSGWRLDVVSLLAFVGPDQTQVMTSSWLCLLPRLIPGPQSLLVTERPQNPPPVRDVKVIGIYSGERVDKLNYFANLIHQVNDISRNTILCYEIEYKSPARPDIFVPQKSRWSISHSIHSSLDILSVLSCLASIALLIAACCVHDGTAALAVIFLSFESSLACAAWRWSPSVVPRPQGPDIPPGDVVLCTANGSFIVVRCDDFVARQLYLGRSRAWYVLDEGIAQAMTGLATILLMVGFMIMSDAHGG